MSYVPTPPICISDPSYLILFADAFPHSRTELSSHLPKLDLPLSVLPARDLSVPADGVFTVPASAAPPITP